MPDEPSIVAAGGWCMPSDQRYELMKDGTFTLGYAEIAKRTPEEWAAIRAGQKARVEAEMAVAQRRYFETRERLMNDANLGPARTRVVLDHIAGRHQPRAGSYSVECSCWHNQGYEVEAADWPCDDFSDVARAVGL